MNTLNELFDRDPAEITDEELEKVIVYLREKREKWTQEEKEKKPRAKAKAGPKPALDELDIEL